MNIQAQQKYLNAQVNTVAPGELTLMLYNGCLKFMKQAQTALENRDYEGKNTNIKKAKDIIDELIITLNMDYPISSNLLQLYTFINEKLFEANLRKNIEALKVSIELVSELRDTWGEALRSLKSNEQLITG